MPATGNCQQLQVKNNIRTIACVNGYRCDVFRQENFFCCAKRSLVVSVLSWSDLANWLHPFCVVCSDQCSRVQPYRFSIANAASVMSRWLPYQREYGSRTRSANAVRLVSNRPYCIELNWVYLLHDVFGSDSQQCTQTLQRCVVLTKCWSIHFTKIHTWKRCQTLRFTRWIAQ